MDQFERAISFEKVESVSLTVREARWVASALRRQRGLLNELGAPEPEDGFLEQLETRFFRLTPESDGS